LVSREKSAQIQTQQSHAVDAYRDAVAISLDRYRVGNADYYEVLQTQQLLFPEELSLAQTQLNQLLAVVQLYRALGGGWQVEKDAAK
jgi:multidrug efflux system outer membrane protein